MIGEIIKGVSMGLHAAFGEGYRTYYNDVEQGLKEPCFFIVTLKQSLSPLQMHRFMQTNPLDVQYFPRDGGDNAEMLAVAGDLFLCLRLITLPDGSRLRGTEMSYEIVDDVLHFFVTYTCILHEICAENRMEVLQTDVSTAKGGSYGKG